MVVAERVGFEPTKGYKPLLVFKTSAFDHSATSPVCGFAPRIVLAVGRGFNCGIAGALKWREIGTIFAGNSLRKGIEPVGDTRV